MTKSQYSPAYSKCSDSELRSFITDRGLGINWTTRKAVIHALRSADSQSSFRFLDLSPELRNHVYWYLLALREKRGTSHRQVCFPEILCTSHQIYDEAKGILYADENEIVIAYTVGGVDASWQKDQKLHISINHRAVGVDPEWNLRDSAVIRPSFLLNSHRLRLQIGVPEFRTSDRTPGSVVQLNRAVYALANYLKAGCRLQNLSAAVVLKSKRRRDNPHSELVTSTMRLLAGDWEYSADFLTSNEWIRYDREEPDEAFGPYGVDRVRNALHYEEVLGELIGKVGKEVPVEISKLSRIAGVRNRISAYLNSTRPISGATNYWLGNALEIAEELEEEYA